MALIACYRLNILQRHPIVRWTRKPGPNARDLFTLSHRICCHTLNAHTFIHTVFRGYTPTVQRLSRADKDDAVGVLASAFHDYPACWLTGTGKGLKGFLSTICAQCRHPTPTQQGCTPLRRIPRMFPCTNTPVTGCSVRPMRVKSTRG